MKSRDRQIGLAVASGAAIGSVLRFAIASASVAAMGAYFPVGTLTANVIGSFVIAFIARRLAGRPEKAVSGAFWLAGFCGGLTTFSVFSLETILFLDEGRVGTAVVYVAASFVLWLGAAAAGWSAAGRKRSD